jgi:hypothetical protein
MVSVMVCPNADMWKESMYAEETPVWYNETRSPEGGGSVVAACEEEDVSQGIRSGCDGTVGMDLQSSYA